MNCEGIDFSNMNHLSMPVRWETEMAVSVTKGKELSLNGRLLKEISKENPEVLVRIDYTQDVRGIVIRNAGKENDFRFGKNGRIKHREFAEKLGKLGYGIPAKYVVHWDSEEKAWIGILQEVQEAPIPQGTFTNKKGGRKKNN